MARPLKEGLDYFSFDTDMSSDPKIEFLEAKHEITGYGVFVKILEKIYRNGYYFQWEEKELIVFSKRVNVDINSVNAIVNDCLDEGLFNKNIYKKHKIFTSKGIQRRYLLGTTRRTSASIISDYLLLDPKEIKRLNPKIIIVNINPVNDNNNSINDNNNAAQEELAPTESTQSKVKESKVKEDTLYSIFEFWNTQGIIKHRTIDKYKPNINAAIKEYSEGEIKKAISNYNMILKDSNYYWTHRWTLKEFLQRGLDKFRTENNPFDNYKSDKGGNRAENPGAKRPEAGKYDHFDK